MRFPDRKAGKSVAEAQESARRRSGSLDHGYEFKFESSVRLSVGIVTLIE